MMAAQIRIRSASTSVRRAPHGVPVEGAAVGTNFGCDVVAERCKRRATSFACGKTSAKTPASRSNDGAAVITLVPCLAATARLSPSRSGQAINALGLRWERAVSSSLAVHMGLRGAQTQTGEVARKPSAPSGPSGRRSAARSSLPRPVAPRIWACSLISAHSRAYVRDEPPGANRATAAGLRAA